MNESTLGSTHKTVNKRRKHGPTLTMWNFDRLSLPQIKEYSPGHIKQIRLRNKISQSLFAAYLNINPSTIQKWECGENKPKGSALKLLNLVDKKGLDILS
jgi:putative transcriptional regulator